ncbi:MAG: methyl-accepting chemotaxis protein [Arcobacteraceae bacterium]
MFGSISKSELKIIDDYFQQYIRFTQYKQNRFEFIERTGNASIDALFHKWNEQIKQTDSAIKQDINVIGEIVLTSDKVKQGIFKCRIKSETTNPMVSTLKKAVNEMVDALEDKMIKLENTLTSYANEDYRPKLHIEETIKARMLSVMQSINALGDTLSSAAKANLDNGRQLQENSNNMNASMNNLSAKANEQAASLEETAAAVEEITSITRNNASNATKMAELGKTVRHAVTDGEKLASKTAISMDEINEKVTAINDAINVIDQIAFQTNILSLNAAVEAATAGEAGKGFAVVAQEVRNLATRSADAAKEIKNLVEDANAKANAGKNISAEMIEGYKKLNTHMSETLHIIQDVSSASKEQMLGIEQINDAVSMLDKVTQENASEANNVTKIANDVDAMAQQLVHDAITKKFN